MDEPSHRPFVVALTGGIASGKSAASAQLESLGAAVFDADVVARRLAQAGSPALAEIAGAFGAAMLRPDGTLDRSAMRARVFGDAGERRKLEAILHPRVRSELLAALSGCTAPYGVLVIPLLAEAYADYAFVDRVLVLDVSPAVQLARLMGRDATTTAAAQQIIAVQAPRAQRLAIADDVIDNDGALERLAPVLARLHARYLDAAERRLRAG